MAFIGDTFFPLGLPPYTGPLKSEFQNLADGLTAVKGLVSSGGTVVEANPTGGPFTDNLTSITIGTTSYNLATGGGGGTADGVASGLAFAKAGNTVTATIARTQSLASLTDTFDVSAITGVNPLPAVASMARGSIYGKNSGANTSAEGLYYRKREHSNVVRMRIDDITRHGFSPRYRAFGWSSAADGTGNGYYSKGSDTALSPSVPAGLIAVVLLYDTHDSNKQFWLVRAASSLLSGTTAYLEIREPGAAAPSNLLLTRDADLNYVSVKAATDPFSTSTHQTYEVRFFTANNKTSGVPLIAEDHAVQLTDATVLAEAEGDVREYARTLFDSLDFAPYALKTEIPAANRLIPSGGADGQVLKKTSATDYAVGWRDDLTSSGGMADGVTDSFDVSINATDRFQLDFTLSRTGTLSDLNDNVDLPQFDLHDDVATAVTTLAGTDRLLVSAETVAGDPHRYMTADSAANYFSPSVGKTVSGLTPYVTSRARFLNLVGAGIGVAAGPGSETAILTIPGYSDAEVDARVLNRMGSAPVSQVTGPDGFLMRDDGVPAVLHRTSATHIRAFTTDTWAQPGNSGLLPIAKLPNHSAALLTSGLLNSARLQAGGIESQVLQRTVAGNGLRWGAHIHVEDASGDLPTPTTVDIGTAIGIKQDGLYHVESHTFHGTAPTGTWRNVLTRGAIDVTSTKTFFEDVYPDHDRYRADALQPNYYFLDSHDRHFYTRGQHPQYPTIAVPVLRNDPAGWLGFDSEANLLLRASAIGDWGYATDINKVRELTAFTAGVDPVTRPVWAFGAPIDQIRFDVGGLERYSGPAHIILTGSGATLTSNTTTATLDIPGVTAGDITGLVDDRYVNVTGDTMTGGLQVTAVPNARAMHLIGTSLGADILAITTGTHANQDAITVVRSGQGSPWFNLGLHAGGTNKTGIEFGSGTAGADVNLYRDATNILRTDDTFRAAVLGVTGTLATTQTNLGIVGWARTGDTGIIPATKIGEVVATLNRMDYNSGSNQLLLGYTKLGNTSGFTIRSAALPDWQTGAQVNAAIAGAAPNLSQFLTAGNVENFALTAFGTTDIPASKLPTLIRNIIDMTYQAPGGRLRIRTNNNDGAITNNDVTIGPFAAWALTSNTAVIPTAKLGTATANARTFLRGDGTWGVPPAMGGGGGPDMTLAVLTESLNGDGTADLATVNPNVGGATVQDYMLIFDRSTGALRRTGLGDMAVRVVSANPGNTGMNVLNSIKIGTTNWALPMAGGGGATTFIALTDTPGAFGTATQILQVNAARTGLEWTAKPTGGGGGTTVVANPTTNATTPVISSITIGTTPWRIAGGVAVREDNDSTFPSNSTLVQFGNTEFNVIRAGGTASIELATGIVKIFANPSGTGTHNLTKVQIGTVIYDLPGAGGGLNQTEVDARINSLVPAADTLALTAVDSTSSHFGDRHSWKPSDINTYIQALAAGGALGTTKWFLPETGAGDNGMFLSVAGGRRIWVPAPSGGGTTVAANPGGSGNTALGSITIGTTDYDIAASLVFNSVTFSGMGTTTSPYDIANAGINRGKLDVNNAGSAGDTLHYAATGLVWARPTTVIQEGGTTVASFAQIINFDDATFNVSSSGATATITGVGGGGGGGGGAELVGRGDVSANHNNAADTGIDMPTVETDDLFTVFVENKATRRHSGSLTFTGQAWNRLSNWGVGQAEGAATTLAMDQGDLTDNEYFVGKDSSGNVLVSSNGMGGDDLTVSVYKYGAAAGGGGTTVVGNPSGNATTTLNKVTIGTTIYSIDADDAFDWATTGNSDLVPTAKLGSGTAGMTRYLRGDGTWAAVPAVSTDLDIASLNALDGSNFVAASDLFVVDDVSANESKKMNGTQAVQALFRSVVTSMNPTSVAQTDRFMFMDVSHDGGDPRYLEYSDLINLTDARVANWARLPAPSGTAPVARLGTGSPSSSNYLRGDGTWAAVTGGGVSRTDEEIRDVAAAQLTEGTGISIFKDDPNNRVTISADTRFEVAPALMFINANGEVGIGNRDYPGDSYRVGDLGNFGDIKAADFINGFVYFINVSGSNVELWRTSPTDLLSPTKVGNFPAAMADSVTGLAWNGTTAYAYVTITNAAQTWAVNLTTPGSSSLASTVTDTNLTVPMSAGQGLVWHNSKFYAFINVIDKIYEIDPANLNNSSELSGTIPTSGTGSWTAAASVRGKLYISQGTAVNRTLWEANVANASNSRSIGAITSIFGVRAMAGVELPLSSLLVPEDVNLYFTNARADARINALVQSWARSATEQIPQARLGSGTPGFSNYLRGDGQWAAVTGGGGTTVTANPATDTTNLDRLTIGSDSYAVRTSFSVLTPGDLPTPTARTVGNRYYVVSEAIEYAGIDDQHTPATSTGTFGATATNSDLHIITDIPGNFNNLTVGDYYFLNNNNAREGGGTFRELVTRQGSRELEYVRASVALAGSRSGNSQTVIWLGREATTTEALRFTYTIVSGEDYIFFNITNNRFEILTQSTFTGAGTTSHHYLLRPINNDVPPDDTITPAMLAADSAAQKTALRTRISAGDGTYASLTGKPAFATVATSGSYNDLTNKPTIPGAFDLFADVGTELTTMAFNDRMLAADVSSTGEPNRWVTATTLADYIRPQVRFDGSTVQDQVRFFDFRGAGITITGPSDRNARISIDIDSRIATWGRAATGAATARTQLGLGSAATEDTGTVSGEIPVLSTNGVLARARLGTGSATRSEVLRGDGVWRNQHETWSGSQASYDALTPDSNTIYLITS